MSENKREMGVENCAYKREETGAAPDFKPLYTAPHAGKTDKPAPCFRMELLEQLVRQWAHDKGIMEKATPIKQGEKTGEEYAEMMVALGKQQLANDLFYEVPRLQKVKVLIKRDEITEEIKDAIGDQVVTLIIQCAMQGFTLADALQSAYDIISKRTGKMVDGKFVKDGGKKF